MITSKTTKVICIKSLELNFLYTFYENSIYECQDDDNRIRVKIFTGLVYPFKLDGSDKLHEHFEDYDDYLIRMRNNKFDRI